MVPHTDSLETGKYKLFVYAMTLTAKDKMILRGGPLGTDKSKLMFVYAIIFDNHFWKEMPHVEFLQLPHIEEIAKHLCISYYCFFGIILLLLPQM